MPENSEGRENVRSLKEAETIAFLKEHGVEPLSENWRPHQPLLFVLENNLRTLLDRETGKERPPDKIASIARVDDPTKMQFSVKDPKHREYNRGQLFNDGGQIDYYAIDFATRKPVHLGASRPARMHFPFLIWRANLFTAADHLFPKSAGETKPE